MHDRVRPWWPGLHPCNALPSTTELQMGSEAEAPVPELGSFILEGPLVTACCKQEDSRKWGPRLQMGSPFLHTHVSCGVWREKTWRCCYPRMAVQVLVSPGLS